MDYQFATASVKGREHQEARTNSQDAFQLVQTPQATVAVVCDGCGEIMGSDRLDSEVGAKLGAALVSRSMVRQANRILVSADSSARIANLFGPSFFDRVRADVLAQIRVLAMGMGDSLTEVVHKYFLFTTVGVLIVPRGAAFFYMGDGVVIINGEVNVLEALPGNEPIYFVYGGLLETSLSLSHPDILKLEVLKYLGPGELDTFLVGCDGVNDLMSASCKLIPGTQEEVGPIEQFWGDRYFASRYGLQKRLKRIANDAMQRQQDGTLVRAVGLLRDDTTFIVGRQVKPVVEGS